MTNVTNLPRQRPRLDQLHEPRSAISDYVGEACCELLQCQGRVLATDTPEYRQSLTLRGLKALPVTF